MVVIQVAAESSRELKDVQKEAQELLEEIGHKMALPAVRSLALVLRSVLRRILKGIFVNKPGLEKVGCCAHVFVRPTLDM